MPLADDMTSSASHRSAHTTPPSSNPEQSDADVSPHGDEPGSRRARGHTAHGVVAVLVTRSTNDNRCRAAAVSIDSQAEQPEHLVIIDAEAGDSRPPHTAAQADEHATLDNAIRDFTVPTTFVSTPGARNLSDAIHRAYADNDRVAELIDNSTWLWIIHDDCVAHPQCLSRQWNTAQSGRTIGVVGAKQVAMDGLRLLELGIRATRSARRVDTVMPDEIDQGQYDDTSDVLAVGTAGMLVSRQAWTKLGGLSPYLGPFGDGLEFGRRARRAGYRVVVAPKARVRHEQASLRDQGTGHPDDASFHVRRYAQLFNWMAAVPWWQLPLLMVALTVWTPLRAIGRIMTSAAHLAIPELSAWLKLVAHTPDLIRARHLAARTATLPRRVLASVEASPREVWRARKLRARTIRARNDMDEGDPIQHASLRSYRMTSAVTFTVMTVITVALSIVLWHSHLSTLRGGAWLALPSTWKQTAQAALTWWLPSGSGIAAVPDPFLVLLTVLTAPLCAVGVSPTYATALLLAAAIPASCLTMWALSCAVTTSVRLRVVMCMVWACPPTLLLALLQGRLSAALVHVFLPLAAWGWIRLISRAKPTLVVPSADGVATVDRHVRAGGAWGIAAISLAVIVSAVPALMGAAVLIAAVALMRWRRRAAALAWSLVPAGVVITPLVSAAIRTGGTSWHALITPGGGTLAVPPAQAWQIALGLPFDIRAPYGELSRHNPSVWTWLNIHGLTTALICGAVVIVMLAVCALLSILPVRVHEPFTRMWGMAVAALSLFAAYGVSTVPVALGAGAHAPVGWLAADTVAYAWPGPFISLGLLGMTLALSTCDSPHYTAKAEDGELTVRMRAWSQRPPLIRSAATALVACTALVPMIVWVTMMMAPPTASRVTATSRPALPAVSTHAQESPRGGRTLVIAPLEPSAETSGPAEGTGAASPHDHQEDEAVTRAQGTLAAWILRAQDVSWTDDSALTRWARLIAVSPSEADGDAALPDPASAQLLSALATLVATPDEQAARILYQHNIDTVVCTGSKGSHAATSHCQANVEESLDKVAALEKVGDTDAGALWRVRPDSAQPAHLRIGTTPIDSTQLGTSVALDTGAGVDEGVPATLVWAERSDVRWHATVDGRALEYVTPSEAAWAQGFALPESGHLVITWSWWPQTLWRVVLAVAGAACIMGLVPLRRRT